MSIILVQVRIEFPDWDSKGRVILLARLYDITRRDREKKWGGGSNVMIFIYPHIHFELIHSGWASRLERMGGWMEGWVGDWVDARTPYCNLLWKRRTEKFWDLRFDIRDERLDLGSGKYAYR